MKINIKVSKNKTFLALEKNRKILAKDELMNHDLFEKLIASIDKLIKLPNIKSSFKINVICTKNINNLSCNIAKIIARALNL